MEKKVIKTPQIPISPQKLNLVADLVRKKKLDCSLDLLSFTSNKGGRIIHRLLLGAKKILEKEKESSSDFYLNKIEVNRGRIQKKVIYRAKGRTDRLRKRYSLVNLYLSKSLVSDSKNK